MHLKNVPHSPGLSSMALLCAASFPGCGVVFIIMFIFDFLYLILLCPLHPMPFTIPHFAWSPFCCGCGYKLFHRVCNYGLDGHSQTETARTLARTFHSCNEKENFCGPTELPGVWVPYMHVPTGSPYLLVQQWRLRSMVTMKAKHNFRGLHSTFVPGYVSACQDRAVVAFSICLELKLG